MKDDLVPKKFVIGRSVAECKAKLNDMYGANWQSLGSEKCFFGGFLGFGQKEGIRLDYYETKEHRGYSQPISVKADPSRVSDAVALINSRQSQFADSKNQMLKNQVADGTLTSVMQIANLTQKMETMQKQITEGFANFQKSADVSVEHRTITEIKNFLEENEFTKKFISAIAERMKNTFTLEELNDFDEVQKTVIDWIGEGIVIAEDSYIRPPKIIVLCGPTGVGKTTTIAKLIAAIKLNAKKEEAKVKYSPVIRIITTDVTRVGAMEQIKNWAGSMRMDVEKAENEEELLSLLRNYKDSADYIFIDTAGYSPNDVQNIARMCETLKVHEMNKIIYLTVSAGTKAKDLEIILRNYEVLDYKSVIITKCDETFCYGGLISVLTEKRKPLSYLTYGQDVFQTIEKANPLRFLRSLDKFSIDFDHIDEKFGRKNSDKLI